MSSAETLQDCGDALAAAAGLTLPVAMTPLDGGRNNRVYRVTHAGGERTILKRYFRHPDDPRDRLAHEWQFATYAWRVGVRAIAEPLAVDPDRDAALFAELPGRPCANRDVTAAGVAQAAAFVRDLNRERSGDSGLPAASEACFSLAEHVATVERRISRLDSLEPAGTLHRQAHDLVQNELMPRWRRLAETVERDAACLDTGFDGRIPAAEIILSPSDFGFHNAVICDGRLAFVDFEYAGRDDPAKLIGDFFNQVERPVPLEHLPAMLDAVAQEPETAKRARLLLPLYAVKWATILLNDFLPTGAARRQFALSGDGDARLVRQLVAARAKLKDSEVTSNA